MAASECQLFSSRSSRPEPTNAAPGVGELDAASHAALQRAHLIKCLEAADLEAALVGRTRLQSCPDIREFLKTLELQLLQAILDSTVPEHHAKLASAWLACEDYFVSMSSGHVA